MTGEQPETPALQPSAPSGETDSLISPLPDLIVGSVGRYGGRFFAVYAGLGAVLLAAMAAFAVLVVKPGHKAAASWSAWEPTPGSVAKMTSQIADHVSHRYRLAAGGSQLVAVVQSKPTVTSGTTNIAIKAIAIRKAPQSNTGIEVLNSNKTHMFTFCGLGLRCSISGGQATALRGRLVRREALEVALYTFKFVPSVDLVLAFMPPPPGTTASPLLLLRKQDLTDVLNRPLRMTLKRTRPPLPTENDQSEAPTIDQLTLSNLFSYSLTSLQTGGAAIVLDPAT